MMRRLVLAWLVTVAGATQASAQRGTFEVGLFPNVSYFDRSLVVGQGQAGPGGRLGYFIPNNLAVEGEGAWVPAEGRDGVRVSYIPFRARLALNTNPIGHIGFLIGAGYVHSMLKRDYDFSDDGATGSVGVRLGLGE